MTTTPTPTFPHIVIFPFMSKGHTIPLLHLSHLLQRRRLATVTFITTPLNAAFIRANAEEKADIITLPFPDNIPGIPHGVESTDQLPSISLFLPFVNATKQLKPHFEYVLSSQPNVSFLISDGFLAWTAESALTLRIPRAMFYGMGNFAHTVFDVISFHRPHAGITSEDQPFLVPGFPDLKVTLGDLDAPFNNPNDPDPNDPLVEFHREVTHQKKLAQALIVNSFYTLDAPYFNYWNKNFKPKGWCVGPLCLAKPKTKQELVVKSEAVQWLDFRAVDNKPVLYVAFGSQADVSEEQKKEIASVLESSGMDFMWVVRGKGFKEMKEFEERVREKGMVVKGWVDQMEILRHKSVKGFVSHCGWNSVMESICCGVPILAWPMMAEQHLNAKFVVDELGIGLRVRARDGSKHGLVDGDAFQGLIRELLVGEKGKVAMEKVNELALEAQVAANTEGGSSALSLEKMIAELCQKRLGLQALLNGH